MNFQTFLKFSVVTAQLGVLFLVADIFRIEESLGFRALIPVVFVGFVVNTHLPLRFRPLFFFLVSLAGFITIMGMVPGLLLVILGLILFGIAHLPVAITSRVVCLLIVALVLIALRLGWIETPVEKLSTLILPILGSMFMFRLAIYLFDLRHEKKPVPIWTRLSYFFLLPNVCFPLFPVVDYTTFKQSYYTKDQFQIYQKGNTWILRGIIHLLLYRLIYHYLTPNPAAIDDFQGTVTYIVTSYLLYLRISGLFHLASGIICLFGFDLPRTNNFYFLAASFTDVWRRINIYWKNWMTKLIYNPMAMKLRRSGSMSLNSIMVAGTLTTLIVSWFLHSYQWLWLRGAFPIRIQDAVFWIGLGVLAAISAAREVKQGRKRSLTKQRITWSEAATRSVKILFTFLIMCLLWSFWSCTSVIEWMTVLSKTATVTFADIIALIAVMLTVVLTGTGIQMVAGQSWRFLEDRKQSVSVALSLGATAALLVVTLGLQVANHMGIQTARYKMTQVAARVLSTIKGDRLNERDQEQLTRGYYEELLGSENLNSAVWSVNLRKPADWDRLRVNGAARDSHDLRVYELIPSIEASYAGATLRTNQWGMRDKEYIKKKPPNTYRIAVLGSSYTMGTGVENDEVFEVLVEDRLNREHGGRVYDRYEILNFSVPGYSVLCSAVQAEMTVFEFEPDLVVFFGLASAESFVVRMLAKAIDRRLDVSDARIDEIIERSGATRQMSLEELETRLRPFANELIRESFQMLGEGSQQHGAKTLFFYLPVTFETPARSREIYANDSAIARDAGFLTVFLGDAYGEVNPKTLWVAPWDNHPNAVGHELIAEAIYKALVKNSEALALGLDTETAESSAADGETAAGGS